MELQGLFTAAAMCFRVAGLTDTAVSSCVFGSCTFLADMGDTLYNMSQLDQ